MQPSQQDIKAIAEIQKLPVNISIDGLTAFMLIAQLQLALRHPSNTGETADKVREIVVNLQNQLQTRSPDLKPILDKGWHPEFDVSTNKRIVNVHNVYTLYSDADSEGNKLLSVSSRPQDWGDPRWHYHFVKLEINYSETIYINNAHLWTTEELDIPQLTGTFGQALGMIMQPGRPHEICDRSHLYEDDFWCDEWGEMPPYYMGSSTDDEYFDYGE